MIFVLIVLCAMFVSCSQPAKTIEELLPPGSKMSTWQKNGPASLYKQNQLFEYINGGADIYLEYGFVQVITQEYIHNDESLVVEVYEMQDPIAAFGIYSINRDSNAPALKVGDEGWQFEYQTTFWQDRFYVVIMGYKADQIMQGVTADFAAKISKKIYLHAKPPEIISLLPQTGLQARSTCYLKGLLSLNTRFYFSQQNILSLGETGVEAVCGSYQITGGEGQMMVVRYPTPAEAASGEKQLAAALAEQYQGIKIQDILLYKDDKGRWYTARVAGDRLCVIFKADTEGSAIELLRSIG
jgi:hypothetical protein